MCSDKIAVMLEGKTVLNEEKTIKATLTSIHSLLKDTEIIVVDGGSQDKTLKTLLKMHKIKLLYLLGTPVDKLNLIYRDVR